MTSPLAARDVPSLQEKEYDMAEVPQSPATASWQKGRGSAANDCVEVTNAQGHVWVRDSKNPLGPALGFPREGWAIFLVGVQGGEFARSGVPA